MIPSGLDYPPEYNDDIMPKWAHDIADTFDMLFYSQTWREDTKWADFFDKVAQKARCAYVEEGLVIIANCYYKLYKHRGIQNFDEYVEKIVRRSKWQSKQLMQAATVGWHLICQGFEVMPTCVSQATTLLECVKSKKDENVTLASAWEQCTRIASGLKKNITANFIELVVGGKPVKKKKNIKVDVEVHEGLCKQAHERGLTLDEFLIQMSKGEESDGEPEPTPPEEHQAIGKPEQDHSSTENGTQTSQTILLNEKAFSTQMKAQNSNVKKAHEIFRPEPPY